VPEAILALAPQAEKVAVGKRCGRHSKAQRFINKRLADAARVHAVVVRLKGGDPALFGRAQEELDYLRSRGIAVEIVPGVTAALAAAAQSGVSLTQRGVARSVAFVTPRVGEGAAPSSWLDAARAADTVAIYMGAGDAPAIAAALIAAGKSANTPVALVENASHRASRTLGGRLCDLAALAQELGDGAAMILVGEAVRRVGAIAVRPTTRRARAR
jgi:uroporphyrin-III C-methyltransferase